MTSPEFSPKPKRRRLFVVRRVSGRSMSPALQPGQVVVGIWPRRIVPGDVVIVYHNGLEKVKRVAKVRSNGVFVEGDNRDSSTDSRDFGWLERRAVIAKVVWPRLR